MAQVLVRQVEDSVVEALKRKAAMRGASLEAYVRELMARDAAEDRRSIAARLRAEQQGFPAGATDSTALIRARRDGLDEAG